MMERNPGFPKRLLNSGFQKISKDLGHHKLCDENFHLIWEISIVKELPN